MERDSDASFLGSELRRARLGAGISSQDELANKFGYERTVIAKAESGLRPPSPDVALAYAREFPRLNALVEDGLIERWAAHVRKAVGSLVRFFHSWVDHEQTATALFYWEPILVPGLLQTAEYARAVMAPDPDSDEPLDDRVQERLDRQRILAGPNPPIVSVVLAEAVLHRCVGGPAVMYEQLSHLVAASRRPRVTVQVIPATVGAHTGLTGSVAIADQDDGTSIVHEDGFSTGRTSGDPEVVGRVQRRAAVLRADALPREASRELILKVAEERWSAA